MIPIVDQVADFEDVVANLMHLCDKKEENNKAAWIALILTAVGCIPILGSACKGVFKIVLKKADNLLRDDVLKLLRKLGKGDPIAFIKKIDWNKITKETTENLTEIFEHSISAFKKIKNKIPGIGKFEDLITKLDDMIKRLESLERQIDDRVAEVFAKIKGRLDNLFEGNQLVPAPTGGKIRLKTVPEPNYSKIDNIADDAGATIKKTEVKDGNIKARTAEADDIVKKEIEALDSIGSSSKVSKVEEGNIVVKKEDEIMEATSREIKNAADVAKESLEDFRKRVEDGELLIKDPDGDIFKAQKVAIVIDKTDPENVYKQCVGFNRNWDYNPTINYKLDGNNVNKKLNEFYEEAHLNTLTDKYIDEIFEEYPDHFKARGVDKAIVKEEMGKLRDMIDETKAVARKKAEEFDIHERFIAPNGEYSLQKGWSVENCAEVWAARNGILNGVKLNDMVLRTVNFKGGKFAELCKNCKQTFKKFIEEGRIIKD